MSVISLNVQGLRNKLKREKIFQYCRRYKANYILLQETHSLPQDEVLWKKEWGDDIIFSHGTNHSAGVAILMGKGAVGKAVTNTYQDREGRLAIAELGDDRESLTLINIYAPNDDKGQEYFYDNLHKILLTKVKSSQLIIGGDFNVYLDHKLDKKGGIARNRLALHKLTNMMLDMSLVDVWRKLNPNKKKFTWPARANAPVACRLDFWLVSKGVVDNVISTKICESICTDHRLVQIKLRNGERTRGPGFWKINNSMLLDHTYVWELRKLINEKKAGYRDIADARLRWELLKYEIQSFSRQYAKKKAKLRKELESKLQSKLQSLDEVICEGGVMSEDILIEYSETKRQLERIVEYKVQGAAIRSKVEWQEKGEKSTRYFFNLEKSRKAKGVITELEVAGRKVTKPLEILEAEKHYYEALYSEGLTKCSQEEIDRFLIDPNINTLSQQDQALCEGRLTEDEVKKAVNEMRDNKSPGSDGLTKEFYVTFWPDLNHDLLDSLNTSFSEGELSTSQKQGVITLLKKEGKDPLSLTNWRPVSLLNVDYKIATKAIANRIKPLLPKLVHPDQTGFIPGRYIGENIRLIEDIFEYTDKHQLSGLCLMVDFQKAFDTLDWKFMERALRAYKFGGGLIKWVQVFYKDVKSTVINNGYSCGWFPVKRGVRQGCPLSTMLFVLSVELLAAAIRKDSSIEGITVAKKEIKLTQFADDMTAFVRNVTSAAKLINLLHSFGKVSGLCMNNSKTKAIWLGSSKMSRKTPLPVEWTKQPTRVLGIHISYNERQNVLQNFENRLKAMQSAFSVWGGRDLTILGRSLITKSIGVSKLVYAASMTTVPMGIVNEADKLVKRFIWGHRTPKVKWRCLVNDYSRGGIKAPDMSSKVKALRLAWIRLLLGTPVTNWQILPLDEFNKYGGLEFLLHCTLDTKYLAGVGKFYRELLEYWQELKPSVDPANQIIWNNRHIKVNEKPVFYRHWRDKGIVYIKDIIDGKGNILSVDQMKSKYDLSITFLHYASLIKAIPEEWKLWLISNSHSVNNADRDCQSTVFTLQGIEVDVKQAKCNLYYQCFIAKMSEDPTSYYQWLSLGYDVNEVLGALTRAQRLTKDTRMLQFYYFLVNRVVCTRQYLYQIKVKDVNDNLCAYCNGIDTLEHAFITCPHVMKIWCNVQKWLKNECQYDIQISQHSILLLSENKEIENVLKLIVLQYIYKSRLQMNHMSLFQAISDIKGYVEIEFFKSKDENKVTEFLQKWDFLIQNMDLQKLHDKYRDSCM